MTENDIYTETWTRKVPTIHREETQNGYNRIKLESESTQYGWSGNESEIQVYFNWGIVPEASLQMTRAEYKTHNREEFFCTKHKLSWKHQKVFGRD